MKIKRLLQSALYLIVSSSALWADSSNQKVARPTSEDFSKSVIYQIHLPIFTQGGTLESARKMLPHIASLAGGSPQGGCIPQKNRKQSCGLLREW